MRKLLTLLFVTLMASSAFAADVTLSKLTYEDGSTANKKFNPGDEFKIAIEYTSDTDTTVYLWVQSKNENSPLDGDGWKENKFWFAEAVNFKAGTSLTDTVTVTIPSEVTEANMLQFDVFRMGVSGTTSYWGKRIKNSSGTNVLVYGSVEEAVIPSAIKFTNLTWDNGTKAEKTIVEGALDSVIIRYNDAEANDSVYVIITAKYVGDVGTWSSTVLKEKVACPVGQDSVIFAYNVHDFNTTTGLTDPNKYRIFLSDGGTAWGDKISLEDNNSDALYGVVEQDVATSVAMPEQMNLSLYPNPTSGMVNLMLDEAATIAVYDLSGKSVYSAPCASGLNNINLTSCDAGLYIVTVNNGDTVQSLKLQIK